VSPHDRLVVKWKAKPGEPGAGRHRLLDPLVLRLKLFLKNRFYGKQYFGDSLVINRRVVDAAQPGRTIHSVIGNSCFRLSETVTAFNAENELRHVKYRFNSIQTQPNKLSILIGKKSGTRFHS
jgi:hypothetical protein